MDKSPNSPSNTPIAARTLVLYDDLIKVPSTQDRRKVIAKRRSSNQSSEHKESPLNSSQSQLQSDHPDLLDHPSLNVTSDQKNEFSIDVNSSSAVLCSDAPAHINPENLLANSLSSLLNTGPSSETTELSNNKTAEPEAPVPNSTSSPELKNQNRKASHRNRRGRDASEDSERELLAGHQALPIDAETFVAVRANGVDWSTPAADANEYLARVVCEAAALPRVFALRPDDAVVKKHSARNHYWHRSVVHSFQLVASQASGAAPSGTSSASVSSNSTTGTCPNRVPPLDWQLACVSSFERTRREFARARSRYLDFHADDIADCGKDASASAEYLQATVKLPAATDAKGWLCFCFGFHNATQYRARLRADYRAACAAARPPTRDGDGDAIARGGVKRRLSRAEAGERGSSSSDSDSDASDFDYKPAVRIDLDASATASEQLAALKLKKETTNAGGGAEAASEQSASPHDLTSAHKEQTPPATTNTSKSKSKPRNEGRAPLMSLVSRLENEDVVLLLEVHARWLGETRTLSPRQAEWLFALLACLDEPFTREAAAAVRDVVRTCRALRESALAFAQSEQQADEAALQPDVDTLNVLICVGSRYFRQYDLADESTL